jgi:TRAP transporter TAXI family solute receptor
MKRIGIIGVALLLVFAMSVFAGGGGQRGGSGVERVRMATGGTAGTYYPFGSAVGQVIQEKVGIPVTIQSTGASKANIQLIAAGEVEMALVQNDVMDYAYRGVDLFQPHEQTQAFSTMAAIYGEVCQIITTSASGIRSIADLRGKNVSVGDAGSGTEFNSRQILEAYGITFNDINKQNLGFGASAEALRDRRIDAFFAVGGAPLPAVQDLATTNDIVVLSIDDASAQRLMQLYPFYSQFTIPANSYRGQSAPVRTVAVKATFVVANTLRDDTVYAMTKALFDYKNEIALSHARGNDIDLNFAVQGMSVPFHPGAARFYREKGLTVTSR